MDNLPELKDIHLPLDGVSIFPLASGWWWILAIFIAVLGLTKVLWWLRKNSKKIYAKYLLNQNAADNTVVSAIKMSELLRRICISRYPEAVALSGQEWINFVNGHAKMKLSEQTAQLLENAPYAPRSSLLFSEENIKNLRLFCQNWIGENL